MTKNADDNRAVSCSKRRYHFVCVHSVPAHAQHGSPLIGRESAEIKPQVESHKDAKTRGLEGVEG